MKKNRDMYFENQGYFGTPQFSNPMMYSSNMFQPGNNPYNMNYTNQSAYNNPYEQRINRLERQIKRMDSRIARLENKLNINNNGYQSTNGEYNINENNMYML